MHGDFSRVTFVREKHFSSVRQQQGRVMLDADANEHADITQHRAETQALDGIGACGAPRQGGGFEVAFTSDGKDLALSPGRFYVDGLLCELEAPPLDTDTIAGSLAERTGRRREDLRAYLEWLKAGQPDEDGRLAGRRMLRNEGGARAARGLSREELLELAGELRRAGLRAGGWWGMRRWLARAAWLSYTHQPDCLTPPCTRKGADGKLELDLVEGRPYLVYLDAWQRHITALDDDDIREKALSGPDTATRTKTAWQVKLLPLDPQGAYDRQAILEALRRQDPLPIPEFQRLLPIGTGLLDARPSPPGAAEKACALAGQGGYTGLENQLYRVEIHAVDGEDAYFKWSRDNGAVVAAIEQLGGTEIVVSDSGRDEVHGFHAGEWAEVVSDRSELSGEPQAGRLVQITEVAPEPRKITIRQSLDTVPPEDLRDHHYQLRRWDQEVHLPGERGVKAAGGAPAPTEQGIPVTGEWLELGREGIQVRIEPGAYRPGDYWLIPARTATHQIEWPPPGGAEGDPSARPPAGVLHHFAPLALFLRGEKERGEKERQPEDLRLVFPALNCITAADVRFDDSKAALGSATAQGALAALDYRLDHLVAAQVGFDDSLCHLGAETVQAALEALCLKLPPAIEIHQVRVPDGPALEPWGQIHCDDLARGLVITCSRPPAVVNPLTCLVNVLLPFPLNAETPDQLLGHQPVTLAATVECSDDGVTILWRPTDPVRQMLVGGISSTWSGSLAGCLLLKGDFYSGLRSFGDFELWFGLRRDKVRLGLIPFRGSPLFANNYGLACQALSLALPRHRLAELLGPGYAVDLGARYDPAEAKHILQQVAPNLVGVSVIVAGPLERLVPPLRDMAAQFGLPIRFHLVDELGTIVAMAQAGDCDMVLGDESLAARLIHAAGDHFGPMIRF